MEPGHGFFNKVLDSVQTNIAVTDESGLIVYTNNAWLRFGRENAASSKLAHINTNYFSVCEQAAACGDAFGKQALDAIERVLCEHDSVAYMEYPCDSPTEKRWFTLRITRFFHDGKKYLVMAHQDITRRKLAEIRAVELSYRDSLTGLYNRRYFDQHLETLWEDHLASGQPLAVALLDIDYFKLLNDSYGHARGDECLAQVGSMIKDFAKRYGALAARYGGEEFGFIFSHSDLDVALAAMEDFSEQLSKARIEHRHSPNGKYLTASTGIASQIPEEGESAKNLFIQADSNLYKAKKKGRDRTEV